MNGEPCIRNIRIPVDSIVTMVAQGMKTKEILDSYPDLQDEDIKEALEFAVSKDED